MVDAQITREDYPSFPLWAEALDAIMDRLTQTFPAPRGGLAVRAVAWCVSATTWTVATVVGGLVAVVLAGGMLIMAVMATLLMFLGATAVRARRTAQAQGDPGLIEARHIGGHSWVAYGWDGSR